MPVYRSNHPTSRRRNSTLNTHLFNPRPVVSPAASLFYSWPIKQKRLTPPNPTLRVPSHGLQFSTTEGGHLAPAIEKAPDSSAGLQLAVRNQRRQSAVTSDDIPHIHHERPSPTQRQLPLSVTFAEQGMAEFAGPSKSLSALRRGSHAPSSTSPPSFSFGPRQPAVPRIVQEDMEEEDELDPGAFEEEEEEVAGDVRLGHLSPVAQAPTQSKKGKQRAQDAIERPKSSPPSEGEVSRVPKSQLAYTSHPSSFTVNAKSPKERRYDFTCSQSRSDDAIGVPPVADTDDRQVGDIHVHVYMGGRQYWIRNGEDAGAWMEVEEGAAHPQLGKTRVLSHRSPHLNLPSWVLQSTFVTYRYRDKKQGA